MVINSTIKKGILLTALALSAFCLFQARAGKDNANKELTTSAKNSIAEGQAKIQEDGTAKTPDFINNEPIIYLDNTDQTSVQGEGIRSVAYSSSNQKVAKINQKGKITPRKKGTTIIRAKVIYQAAGTDKEASLSYTLKVLGKSKEYFEFTDADGSYDRESDPAVITGLTDAGRKLKELYIPERYQGKKITKIDMDAFNEGSAMERAYISDYVKHLDYWFDYEGEPLSTACCFDTGCSKLKEIHLGKNVETFGTSKNLPNLETITVTPGNQTFYVEDGVLYSKENEKNDESSNAVICYPAKKKGSSYRIPEGIADIAGGAFAWAKSLEQVHLPKGIRLIGNCAFSHSGLKEVVLPEGIQNISSAFADCSHLEKVTIPKISGDGHMGYAFKNCLRLKMVMMQNLPQYFACAFSGCSSLEELQLPENLKGIVQKEGVLFDSNLHTLLFYPAGKKDKSYQIPDGVERISDSAFAGTQHLSEVIINRELQIIEENAFMDAKIENIHLNDGLKKICWSAFEGSDILELRLPDNCEIPSSIFENCNKLRSVNLPSNMEILNCGFGGCSSLRSLHIPRKTRKFDGNFLNLKGCTSLSSITVERGSRYFTAVNGVLYTKSKKMLIAYPPAKKGEKFSVPKSVKKISYGAFVDSRFLQQVSMKDSVITCGMNAFSGGTALRTVKLSKKLKKIDYDLFSGCRKLQKITIPDHVKKIEYGAFDGCTSLKSITLGKRVKKIRENAFRDCQILQKLTLRKKTWEKDLTLEKCFVRTGSKNYRKLALKLPKKWKKDRGMVMYEFYDAGLSKKAKIKYY